MEENKSNIFLFEFFEKHFDLLLDVMLLLATVQVWAMIILIAVYGLSGTIQLVMIIISSCIGGGYLFLLKEANAARAKGEKHKNISDVSSL